MQSSSTSTVDSIYHVNERYIHQNHIQYKTCYSPRIQNSSIFKSRWSLITKLGQENDSKTEKEQSFLSSKVIFTFFGVKQSDSSLRHRRKPLHTLTQPTLQKWFITHFHKSFATCCITWSSNDCHSFGGQVLKGTKWRKLQETRDFIFFIFYFWTSNQIIKDNINPILFKLELEGSCKD